MHVALDLDDVILDFVGNLVKVLRKEYDVRLTHDEIVDWDLRKVLDPIVGENWWHWWKERDWLWATADAIDGAIGGIRTLRGQGHYLEIVTSKPEWAEAQTWRWLGKWRPPVQRVTIVGLNETKGEVTDADLLVDDKFENCAEFVEDGRTALLFTRPHNRSYGTTTLPDRMVRVNSWKGVLAAVELQEEGLLTA